MPLGMSMGRYLGFVSSALFSMFFGAQIVHAIYRPLDGLDEFIEDYKEKQRKLLEAKKS